VAGFQRSGRPRDRNRAPPSPSSKRWWRFPSWAAGKRDFDRTHATWSTSSNRMRNPGPNQPSGLPHVFAIWHASASEADLHGLSESRANQQKAACLHHRKVQFRRAWLTAMRFAFCCKPAAGSRRSWSWVHQKLGTGRLNQRLVTVTWVVQSATGGDSRPGCLSSVNEDLRAEAPAQTIAAGQQVDGRRVSIENGGNEPLKIAVSDEHRHFDDRNALVDRQLLTISEFF